MLLDTASRLGENGVKTLDDLADLAGDELAELLSDWDVSIDDCNAIIMAARAHWFDDEDVDGESAADDGEPGGDAAEETPDETPDETGGAERPQD